MKQPLILFFIALYAFVIVKPMAPIAYYALNYTYISEELCEQANNPTSDCHGKCYVAKKMVELEEQEQNKTIPSFEWDENIVALLAENSCCGFAAYSTERWRHQNAILPKSDLLDDIASPPWFI